MMFSPKCIDHTNLKPFAANAEIQLLCTEAIEYGFGAVCVNSVHTAFVSQLLSETDVKVCVTVGFPLGATCSEIKAAETDLAIEQGAQEIDMVLNVGALKEGRLDVVEYDIASVVQAARGFTTKVILETCFLTQSEIAAACTLAQRAGASFVKTSTGFGTAGATVENVALMKQSVGANMEVKASGGIRTYRDAKAMMEAGASRIGASASIEIMKGYERELAQAHVRSTPSRPRPSLPKRPNLVASDEWSDDNNSDVSEYQKTRAAQVKKGFPSVPPAATAASAAALAPAPAPASAPALAAVPVPAPAASIGHRTVTAARTGGTVTLRFPSVARACLGSATP
jgi:deoxyribose-phosphate aldolase